MTKSCNFFKILDTLKSYWASWRIFRPLIKILDTLESFQTLWKVYGHYEMFPDPLESFHTLWKVCGHSAKVLNTLESFQKLWEFMNTFESLQTLWEVSNLVPEHFLRIKVCFLESFRIFCLCIQAWQCVTVTVTMFWPGWCQVRLSGTGTLGGTNALKK